MIAAEKEFAFICSMKDLLLLHGALGAKSQFDKLADLLCTTYIVHALNFEGHGGAGEVETFQ